MHLQHAKDSYNLNPSDQKVVGTGLWMRIKLICAQPVRTRYILKDLLCAVNGKRVDVTMCRKIKEWLSLWAVMEDSNNDGTDRLLQSCFWTLVSSAESHIYGGPRRVWKNMFSVNSNTVLVIYIAFSKKSDNFWRKGIKL